MNILPKSLFRGVHVLKKNLTNSHGIKDQEYSALNKQFRAKELSIMKFLTHMRQFSDTLNQLSTYMRNIAQDTQELFGEDNPEMSARFFETAELFEKQCVRASNEKIENNVIGPLEMFCQEFKLMKELHQERKTAVLDFEMAKEKLDSLQNKSQQAASRQQQPQLENTTPTSTSTNVAVSKPTQSASLASTSTNVASSPSIQNKRDTVDIPKAKELLDKTKKEYEIINSAGKKKLVEIHEKSLNIFDQTLTSFGNQMRNFPECMKEAVKSLQNLPKSQNNSTTKITLSTKTAVNLESHTSTYTSIKNQEKKAPEVAPSNLEKTEKNPEVIQQKHVSQGKNLPKVQNPIPEELQTEWYYLDDNVQQKGPHTLMELKTMFASGKIDPNTHVFGGDLGDWQPLGEYLSLLKYLKS